MASFKGDGRYRSRYDDAAPHYESSSDDGIDLDETTGWSHTVTRRDPEETWVDQHYDVLQELYKSFREGGEKVFGTGFFQGGGFHHFNHFIYLHTHLLKQK